MIDATSYHRRSLVCDRAVYAQAEATYRLLGNDELGSLEDALAYEKADLDHVYDGDSVAAILVGERLRAARVVLARRRELHASGADVPDPDGADYQRWRDLAREVRERADIIDVFVRGGYYVERAGSNARRGDEEWAAACLVCGGADRMRIWRGPNGRYWCRRCGLNGDAISLCQTLVPGCASWHAAVRYLAAVVGLEAPNEREQVRPVPDRPATPQAARNGSRFEYRAGRVVS